jgi:hypothetical protein
MVQNALTVIVPIKRTDVGALRNLLTTIGNDIKDNPHLSWAGSPSTHFARFVILDPSSPDSGDITSLQGHPPRLLFTSNHDGSFENYMRELVAKFGASMEPIWSKCEGYPPNASTDPRQFTKFIYDHSHLKRDAPPEAFYIACRGVSVQTIERSNRIRRSLNDALGSPQATAWSRAGSSEAARATTRATGGAGTQSASSRLAGFLGEVGSWFVETLVGIRAGDNPNLPVISPETQLAVEDRVTQNQMTVIVPIRRDLKARLLLPIILWAVNRKAAQANGSLSGLTTIHFARWAIIDKGRNLFFESNFDGSWENYIDDFVDRASLGMNAIWGNCSGFPRGGCKDIEWFKKYIRDNQIPAQVFYSAYPESSIKNNLNDLQIARAVRRWLSEDDIVRLLDGSYDLDGNVLRQFVGDPATALFLQGSYNLGVARALDTPIQPSPDEPHENAEPRQNDQPLSGPARRDTKKLALPLLAGAALLAWWLKRHRKN